MANIIVNPIVGIIIFMLILLLTIIVVTLAYCLGSMILIMIGLIWDVIGHGYGRIFFRFDQLIDSEWHDKNGRYLKIVLGLCILAFVKLCNYVLTK